MPIWCQILVSNYPIYRGRKSSRRAIWKSYYLKAGKKNKNNYHMFCSYFNLKQLCIQLETLSSNKRSYHATICAPSYVNIFKDYLLKNYVYLSFINLLKIHRWYIFSICTRTTDQLTNCLNDLNKKHSTIKLEYVNIEVFI